MTRASADKTRAGHMGIGEAFPTICHAPSHARPFLSPEAYRWKPILKPWHDPRDGGAPLTRGVVTLSP